MFRKRINTSNIRSNGPGTKAAAPFPLYALLVLGTAALVLLNSCDLRDKILRSTFVSGGEFSNPSDRPEQEFTRHAPDVYSFRYRFYRSLIIDTSRGLVVVDPMNEKLAARARVKLREQFPDKSVHTLFYSHYHRDHVEGGKHLAPGRVVAHKKCLRYWKDLPDASRILKPTELIQGDRVYRIGGQTIRLLDLGLSHSDTIYAFYLPDRKLVYSPDIGFVKSWPTPGPFHSYFPGYIRAMERIAGKDFRIFVPSHGVAGTHRDFVDSMNMMKELRRTVVVAMENNDSETSAGLGRIFDQVWPVWKKKYGHWHGFNEMAGLNLVRHFAGVDLGY